MGAIPNRISMIPCCCNPIPFGMIVILYGMEPVPNRISIIPRGSKAIPFGIWPNQRSFRLCRSDSEGFHRFLEQIQKRFHPWFLFYRLMLPVFHATSLFYPVFCCVVNCNSCSGILLLFFFLFFHTGWLQKPVLCTHILRWPKIQMGP